MGGKHVWFDPASGNASESEHAGWWHVIVDDNAVSILGESGTLIGSGKWSKRGIGQRYTVGEPISSSQWGKVEHALRQSFSGKLNVAHEAPKAPAEFGRPVASGKHGVVDLRSGAVLLGTEVEDGQVHVRLEGNRVTITDSIGRLARAQFDGKFLGKREPGSSSLSGDAAGWTRVENAIRALAGGAEPTEVPVVEPPTYIEAIVQTMSGEILEQSTTPTTEPILNMFHARVALEGDRVAVVDHVGKGSAKWNGKALVERDAGDSMMAANSALWGAIENAVRQLADARRSSAIQSAYVPPPVETDAGVAKPVRETRSGWWALGAMVVAIGGAIVAWRSMQPGDSIGLVITLSLGAIGLGLAIYTIYGATTRCPSCKAWYRRETTSVENLGSSTETRQESKAVYDSSGQQTGTTYETVTYQVTTYRYHYRCKECSNRWTGAGSSESRV